MTTPIRGASSKKPRGLWRAKAQADARRAALAAPPPRPPSQSQPDPPHNGSNPDLLSTPCEPEMVSDEDSEEEDDEEDEIYSAQWSHRTRMLVTESIASSLDLSPLVGPSLDDWEDLKQLFLKAHEHYDANEFEDALPILRAVIHECHRFLQAMYDPSTLFTTGDPSASSPPLIGKGKEKSPPPHSKAAEVPTAFHTLLGTSFLLFGIILAQQPLLALKGEVSFPVPYWLAALAAFETADNVPARTHLKSPLDFPHDWRLSIMWGRTLIFLAEELLSRKPLNGDPPPNNNAFDFASSFLSPHEESEQYKLDHPLWGEDTIFHIIESRHPHPSSLRDPTFLPPSELIQQALDHFIRGILHMPHQGRKPGNEGNSRSSSERRHSHGRHHHHHHTTYHNGRAVRTIPLHQFSFSRMRELFNIAASVLIVAEKLDSSAARRTWATHADSLFAQMKVEMLKTSTLLRPGDVEKMRGRCWLVIGSAEAESIEAELEKDVAMEDVDVRDTWHAESARVGLTKAVDLLTKSRSLMLEALTTNNAGSDTPLSPATQESISPEDDLASLHEISCLLAEALITLANLTKEEDQREAFYAKAQEVYGGDLFHEDQDVAMSEF